MRKLLFQKLLCHIKQGPSTKAAQEKNKKSLFCKGIISGMNFIFFKDAKNFDNNLPSEIQNNFC